jgi:uncharacterized C2H2 Zn-finger protein
MHPDEKLFENVSFKCPECGELFQKQKEMYNHVKENHPMEKGRKSEKFCVK